MITTIREDAKTVRCIFTNKNELKKLENQYKKLGLTWTVERLIWKRADYEVLLHFN